MQHLKQGGYEDHSLDITDPQGVGYTDGGLGGEVLFIADKFLPF